MAGTRTAGTVDGTPPKVIVSIQAVDASGDKFSNALTLTAVPANADIESWVAAYQAVTQASVYNVTVALEYLGDIDPDNAQTSQRNSVTDGINLMWKDFATLKSQTTRVVAPVPAVLQGNQDIPLLSFVDMLTLIAEEGTLLTAYALQSGQYTNRRQRNNERIRA